MSTIDQVENLPQILKPEDLMPTDMIDEDEVNDLLEDESEQSYEEGIDDTLATVWENDGIKGIDLESVLVTRENTRNRLAILYTLMTFIVFIIIIIVAVVDGLSRKVSIIENLTTIIPVISGVFLGTLGFVLGYYFRKEEE